MNSYLSSTEKERETRKYNIQTIQNQITEFLNNYDNDVTRSNYEMTLKDFKKYLEDQEILILEKNNINRILGGYKDHLKNKAIAETTINQYLTNISVFLNFLELQNIKIPFIKIGHTNKDYKYITRKELDELIRTNKAMTKNKNLAIKNKAIMTLLFFTGARVSELIAIKLKDVHLNEDINYIVIHGKGNTLYDVGINSLTVTAITKLVEAYEITDPESYIFLNFQGKPLTRYSINKMIKKIAMATDERLAINDPDLKISKRATPHSFRHGLAHYLLNEKKLEINKVRDILRHSNIAITNNYLTTEKKELLQIQNNLE